MSKTKPDDYAFPVPPDTGYASVAEAGLTKREHFSSLFHAGMLASPSSMQWAIQAGKQHTISPSIALARAARDHADALIQVLCEP